LANQKVKNSVNTRKYIMWYFLSAVLLLLFTWFTQKPSKKEHLSHTSSRKLWKKYSSWKLWGEIVVCYLELYTQQPEMRWEMMKKIQIVFSPIFSKIFSMELSYDFFFSVVSKKYSPFIFKTLKFKHLFIHTIIIQTFFSILSFYSNFTHLQKKYYYFIYFFILFSLLCCVYI